MQIIAPRDLSMLLARCHAIAGTTIGQLAWQTGVEMPVDLSRHKGWFGMLLERALGATAGNRQAPDFEALGIEMKTLPLNHLGQPKESTYVCTVALQEKGSMTWQQSWVKRKLSKVLWVPVEADNQIALADRYIGQAFLWQPTMKQEQQLQHDWEVLMDKVVLGELASISAKEGDYLQIRPKAAHSRILAVGSAKDGSVVRTNPKGFYLRSRFTKQLLNG